MTDRTSWDGGDYARRIEAQLRELEAAGGSRHGEADLVMTFSPETVLDAGCGTGRVAIELARRGVETTGVDVDGSMLAVARRDGPAVDWVEADLTTLDLGRTFDLVVMAGNVPLFTPPGTEDALVRRVGAHVAVDGHLVAGFQLRSGGYGTADYDTSCAATGLELVVRWSTWEGAPFDGRRSDYAVSVHRRPPSDAEQA